MRLLILVVLLAAAGCIPRRISPLQDAFQKLLSEKDREYEEGFRFFLQAGLAAVPALRSAVSAAPSRGFPVVAILYVAGSGDDVPLEFRARHFARFEWPPAQEEENAIVLPYVLHEIERDLVRTGRPALRVLREALAEEARTETRALAIVRVMLRIGGRAVAEELALLLDQERALGGVRVCDVAAGALLYVGRQDVLLRSASRDALVRSARAWWEKAKDEPEAEWTRQAVEALAAKWQPKDVEGVREVVELLVGETVEDPKEWWGKHPEWRPPAAPLHPESVLSRLSGGRAAAFAANRSLEEATGVRLCVPATERLGELCASIRLWQPPPDLEAAWRRYLGSKLLRFTIAVVGHPPDKESNHLLWHYEGHSNATEEPTGKLEFGSGDEGFLLYVRSRDWGTRLVYGEHYELGEERRTVLREFSSSRPVVVFSSAFKACIVLSVEEVAARRAVRPPEELFQETRRRLRKLAQASEGVRRRRALRALGYCQDPADADFLKEEKAYDALLLLGDPAGLEGQPHLEPYEIEMALRRATDPRVRASLERR